MSRARRLLDLMEILRRHRRPVSGRRLADELGISLRTLYRDIATLQAGGATISGEAGVGYVLEPGFTLPPLMFSRSEIEALVLGTRWVGGRADPALADAARAALAKIAAVVPAGLRDDIDACTLLVGPGAVAPGADAHLPALRDAIAAGEILEITYTTPDGRLSERTIWPFALGFFDQVRVVIAWCELRGGYRHFRSDRLGAVRRTGRRIPRRRQALLAEWRRVEGIGATADRS